MEIKKTKKASLAVVIFVIGVLALCVFAVVIFIQNFSKEEESIFKRLDVLYRLKWIEEDLRVTYNLTSDLVKTLSTTADKYKEGGYHIALRSGEIIITRSIEEESGFWWWSEKKVVISVERKIKLSEITGRGL